MIRRCERPWCAGGRGTRWRTTRRCRNRTSSACGRGRCRWSWARRSRAGRLGEHVADRERAVAADGDQRVETRFAKPLDQLVAAIDLDERAVGLLQREADGIAAIGRAEDRAAEVRDAARPTRATAGTPRRAETPRGRAVRRSPRGCRNTPSHARATTAPRRGSRRSDPGASPPPVLIAILRIGWLGFRSTAPPVACAQRAHSRPRRYRPEPGGTSADRRARPQAAGPPANRDPHSGTGAFPGGAGPTCRDTALANDMNPNGITDSRMVPRYHSLGRTTVLACTMN